MTFYLMRYFFLFVLSGGTVVFVSYLASQGQSRLAGALIVAPIVSLWSYAFLALTEPKKILFDTVIGTAITTPAVVLFILSFLILLKVLPSLFALIVAVGIWLASALILQRLFM